MKKYRQNGKKVLIFYCKVVKAITILINFFFITLIINFFITIYTIYIFFDVKLFHNEQGAKLKIKKEDLIQKEEDY